MSKGIGLDWWNKYKGDTKKDYLNVDNMKNKVPRYYDKQWEKEDPKFIEEIKEKRVEAAKDNKLDKYMNRSEEIIKDQQSKMLKRGYEDEPIRGN